MQGHLVDKDSKVIASNSEQFIALEFKNFRILDSCQFLAGSLDSLVSTMRKDGLEKFKNTKLHFEREEEFELMLRKGVFCYDYFSCREKFEEKALPDRSAFFNRLTDTECSEEDYAHAQHVWNTFKMENLREYHDKYLLTDVLLLADVFEDFRTFSLEHYELDPVHYYTSPGLSFDACLKMTGANIELLTNPDALLFFEKAIRGGVSMISHRFAQANNPLLPTYKPEEETSYIQYLDANNLYGLVQLVQCSTI